MWSSELAFTTGRLLRYLVINTNHRISKWTDSLFWSFELQVDSPNRSSLADTQQANSSNNTAINIGVIISPVAPGLQLQP